MAYEHSKNQEFYRFDMAFPKVVASMAGAMIAICVGMLLLLGSLFVFWEMVKLIGNADTAIGNLPLIIILGIVFLVSASMAGVAFGLMNECRYGGVVMTISAAAECLAIDAFPFKKKIPIDEIDIDGIKQLNLLLDDADYSPSGYIVMNGLGIPFAYRTGRVRLKNGITAQVNITDKAKVVFIPMLKEYSPHDPKTYPVLFSCDYDSEAVKNALIRCKR